MVGRNLALDKYWVKMDGSRRNRRFLRMFQPPQTGLKDVTSYTGPTGQKPDNQDQDRNQQEQDEQVVRTEGARSPDSPAGQARSPDRPV